MKTLFINSKKFDYGQDLAFAGLREVLGPTMVRDLPLNFSYHFNRRPYPKNLGYAPPINRKAHTWLCDQAHAHFSIGPQNADLVVVGSCKPDAFRQYLSIVDKIPSSAPIVLIDGGDREEIGGDLFRLTAENLWNEALRKRPFDLIFKREYLKNKAYAPNVHPLPFSMNLSALGVEPTANKNKDFSFWAVESHPIRTRALEVLKGQFDCDQNGTSKGQIFKSYKYKGRRYHEELAKCRIVLNLRGGGWDTLRYWEVPALGPLMISQRLDIVIPNDFIDGKHIIHCKNDLSDLLDLGRHYLRHESERLRLAQAAHEHLKIHHTHVSRAKYMLDVIRSSIS